MTQAVRMKKQAQAAQDIALAADRINSMAFWHGTDGPTPESGRVAAIREQIKGLAAELEKLTQGVGA